LRRISTNLSPGVKNKLVETKQFLKFKTESQAIAYLIAHFDATIDRITIKQDDMYRKEVDHISNQHTL
jgi:hypothetical protein